MPFPAQLGLIDAWLEAKEPVGSLLEVMASFPDHEPLAYAVRRLALGGGLEGQREALASVLPRLPDTGIQRLLKGIDRADLDAAQVEPVIGVVVESLRSFEVERLSALCLMDRWLKNTDRPRRQALVEEAFERALGLVNAGAPEDLDDNTLLRVPGGRFEVLGQAAASAGCVDALEGRLARFAQKVLGRLQAMPRSLSQANAEEILSRRVYTDPGHFLVELLQNAEDCGAGTFEIEVRQDDVRVWHDGAPFDARDVVGVLSIGQTTKGKGQIGFFGVGFKSVYEICERPQVYSRLFNFEIADISIPRTLAPRCDDDGAPGGGTLLVLPLRRPLSDSRSPQRLYSKAKAVPPETLLTLENLGRFNIRHDGRSRSVSLERGAHDCRLLIAEGQQERRFATAAGHFAYDGPRRERSRVTQTRALVALGLDEDGVPRPLGQRAATVFSHLPTAERSGLRFMIHAHFDLPVDRERLNLESPWNRWALGRAGVLLGQLVERLGGPEASPRVCSGLLEILPLKQELSHEAYHGLFEAARQTVGRVALLEGSDGRLLAPCEAALIDDRALAGALAGVALGERSAAWPLGGRSVRVARAYGAVDFGVEGLVGLLEDGAMVSGQPWPQAWMGPGVGAALEYLGMRLEQVPLGRLEALALVPDQQGLPRAVGDVRWASPQIRGLYGDVRAFVAPELEQTPSAGQAALLSRFSIERHGAAQVVDDLRDDLVVDVLFERAGTEAVLGFLASQPRAVCQGVEALALFPDASGHRWALVGPQRAWLPPGGALGQWLGSLGEQRPALVDEGIAQVLGPWLRALGGQTMDWSQTLALMADGQIEVSEGALRRFHELVAAQFMELSPAICRRLAQTPIFADVHAQRRPLVGQQRAWMPADEAVEALAPQAPWLAPWLRALDHTGRLAPSAVGAADVVNALVEGSEPLLVAPQEDASVRRAYGYLCRFAPPLSQHDAERLAQAPVWWSSDGVRTVLGQLQHHADDPDLAMLFGALGQKANIEVEGEPSTLELVRALGLEHRLAKPDHGALMVALASEQGVSLVVGEHRPALLRVLERAASELDAQALAPLWKAPIFETDGGQRLAPGRWNHPNQDAAHVAVGPARRALRAGRRPLMSLVDQEDFGPVLRALGAAPISWPGFVQVLESDAGMQLPEAQDLAREALVEAAQALVPLAQSPSFRQRLSALPLWGMGTQNRRAATEVVARPQARDGLGEAWLEALEGESAFLEEALSPDAGVLSAVMDFMDPAALLAEHIEAVALEGEVLEAQPALLSSLEQVLEALRLVSGRLGSARAMSLPLSVDARGCLCRGALWSVSDDERLLAAGLVLEGRLAQPQWAAEAVEIEPALVSSMKPVRLLEALAKGSREGSVPSLVLGRGRLRFYAWLLRHQDEIAGDEQALGVLGNAALIRTVSGQLSSPRELLMAIDQDLPADLGLERWLCDDEVPLVLRQWLTETFKLADRHLQHLIGVLIEAHKEAQSESDAVRSAALLEALAKAVFAVADEPSRVKEIVAKHKIHRLRVETDQGGFDRVSRLLSPGPQERALLVRFLAEPPVCVSDRYHGAQVRWLLRQAGAGESLDEARLKALMAHQSEVFQQGLEATLALSRYVAGLVAAEPGLRQRLGLDKGAWIPNGDGQRSAARALYWPDADVKALVGREAALYPHPEFFHTVPERLSELLPFRKAEDAALEDVARRWQGSQEGVPTSVLAWFEQRLRAQTLKGDAVREFFQGRALLRDDDGVARAPQHLVCRSGQELVGDFLAPWSPGLRFSKLASVLGIAQQVGPAQLEAYSRHLTALLEDTDGCDLLRGEPALAERLPRVVAALAEAKAKPWRGLNVLVLEADGRLGVAPLRDPALVLAEPGWMGEVAAASGLALRTVVLEPGKEDVSVRWLLDVGVASLGSLFEASAPSSEGLGADVSARYAAEVTALTAVVERAMALHPGLGAVVRQGDLVVRVYQEVEARGTLAGTEVSFESEAWLNRTQGRLCVTPGGLRASVSLARALMAAAGGAWQSRWVDVLARAIDGELVEEEARALGAQLQREEGRPEPVSAQDVRRAKVSAEDTSEPKRGADPEDGGSLWSRMKRWWSGDDEASDEARDGSPKPESVRPPGKPTRPGRPKRSDDGMAFKPMDHSRFFQGSGAVEPQLRAASSWLQDRTRAPEFGFGFEPSRLAYPHRYAHQCLAARFERSTQRWLPVRLDASWLRPGGRGDFEVSLSGRIPRGENLFPLPMYARLGEVVGEGVRAVRSRDGGAFLMASAPADVDCVVWLEQAPRFEGFERPLAGVPEILLKSTVPDADLPYEVLELIEDLRHGQLPLLERAVAVRRFIQDRYRYDPSYMEDPAVARWLAKVSRGRANRHLAALHAGADGRHLGRGVCYELGALACEVMRRAGVPAAVATGWTWDRGQLTEPDHMWAMALLPSDLGPRWLPIDPSTTREGRPLHVGRRPPGPWRPRPNRSQRPPKPDPSWSLDPPRRPSRPQRPTRPSGASPGRGQASQRRRRSQGSERQRPPVMELMRVVRHLSVLAGEDVSDGDLQVRCRRLLDDPQTARRVLEMLRS